MRECPTCGGLELLVKSSGDFSVAVRCVCQSPCPRCHDAGFAFDRDERGYQVAKPCSCDALDRRIRYFNQAKIPGRYADTTLQKFEAINQALMAARQHAFRFAHEFSPGQSGLLYYGDCGTGKTHLLIAILRHLIVHRGIRVRFIEFVHLLTELRAGFGDRGRTEEIMAPLVEIPVLAVDELGKGRGSDWELSVLDELISKRYNANRTTLFSTNIFPPPRIANRPSLDEVVGERIFSRLKEMCEFRLLAGGDYRERLMPR